MEAARPAVGSQTLARGLHALELVALAQDGMTIQDIAAALGVHRSIASRLLATLADRRLVVRNGDGRFRPGVGLAALWAGVHTTLRVTALPVMYELAGQLSATISLLVAEGDEAVALAVVEPPAASYMLSFKTGSRHPLDRGSAGVALQTAQPKRDGEPPKVTQARALGYAATFGEVEPGAYGVAVLLSGLGDLPVACLNLITHREQIAAEAPAVLIEAAGQISRALR